MTAKEPEGSGTGPGAVAEFAAWMRALHREAKRPSYAEIVRRVRARYPEATVVQSTISDTFNGKRLPRWETVEPIAWALGGDGALAECELRWKQADTALRGPAPVSAAPPPRRLRRRGVFGAGAAAVTVAVVAAVAVYASDDPATPHGLAGYEPSADPCALIDLGPLQQFGYAILDPAYGEFSRCAANVRSEDSPDDIEDVADVSLQLGGRPDYPVQPPREGELGPIVTFPERGSECHRTISLPDLNQIEIIAKHLTEWPDAPLCEMAHAMAEGARDILSREEFIPRRRDPVDARSLASLRACELLDEDDIANTLDVPGVRPEPDFGNWKCYWQRDDLGLDVTLFFWREEQKTPQEHEADGERYINVGSSRDAFLEFETDEEQCAIDIVHRSYRVNDYRENKDWQEQVILQVMKDDTSPEVLCQAARTLAETVVAGLPQA